MKKLIASFKFKNFLILLFYIYILIAFFIIGTKFYLENKQDILKQDIVNVFNNDHDTSLLTKYKPILDNHVFGGEFVDFNSLDYDYDLLLKQKKISGSIRLIGSKNSGIVLDGLFSYSCFRVFNFKTHLSSNYCFKTTINGSHVVLID